MSTRPAPLPDPQDTMSLYANYGDDYVLFIIIYYSFIIYYHCDNHDKSRLRCTQATMRRAPTR